MKVDFARPDVSELVVHVFSRSVHPELLDAYAALEVWHDAWAAVIRICEAGHAIEFHTRQQTVTEVAATQGSPLPQQMRLLNERLRGYRDKSLRFESGLRYHLSFQLEKLDAEVFQAIHDELLDDCRSADLAHRFPPAGRLSPGPLSLVRTEAAPRSLLIHAFHTFPDSFSVVRTQSLFEL